MQVSKTEADKAEELIEKAVVVDTMMQGNLERSFFDRAKSGGLTGFINSLSWWPENFRHTLLKWLYETTFVEQNADRCFLAETADDIRSAKKDGKVAVCFGLQQADCVENDITLLTVWRQLGLKSLQLTYNTSNHVGSGCEEPSDGGLTKFGHDVVEEMNRLGIMIDLSHVGSKTALDAIGLSRAPAVFTHSNPRGMSGHPKTHTDEEIKAMAEKGGVFGIAIEAQYVVWNKWKMQGKRDRVSVDDILDHMEYVINLVGVDHVGVGTDITEFANPENWKMFAQHPTYGYYPYDLGLYPVGMENPSVAYTTITKGLVKRGYSDEEIIQILGENWLRVFDSVWKPNASISPKAKLDLSTVWHYHYPPYYPRPGV